MWAKAAQDEIWGSGPNFTPDVLACSAYVFPALKAVKTADGYLLNSNFPTPFSSGVDLAEWNTIACMLHDEHDREPPKFMQVLLHRSEYKVIDTWYASGLVGSGSKDVLVENVEIPEHRGMLIENTHGGPTPGSSGMFRLKIPSAGFAGNETVVAVVPVDPLVDQLVHIGRNHVSVALGTRAHPGVRELLSVRAPQLDCGAQCAH